MSGVSEEDWQDQERRRHSHVDDEKVKVEREAQIDNGASPRYSTIFPERCEKSQQLWRGSQETERHPILAWKQIVLMKKYVVQYLTHDGLYFVLNRSGILPSLHGTGVFRMDYSTLPLQLALHLVVRSPV